MQRDALISPATSSVLGLRAGMTPFSGIRRVSHGRTVLCECPQGDRHDPNRRLALNRPPPISLLLAEAHEHFAASYFVKNEM